MSTFDKIRNSQLIENFTLLSSTLPGLRRPNYFRSYLLRRPVSVVLPPYFPDTAPVLLVAFRPIYLHSHLVCFFRPLPVLPAIAAHFKQ